MTHQIDIFYHNQPATSFRALIEKISFAFDIVRSDKESWFRLGSGREL